MKKVFWMRRAAMFLLLVPLFLLLAGVAVMLLWNWLMPALFALPVISFWQALGLLVLSRILLGGFGGGRGGRYGGHRRHKWKAMMEERMAGMTEEEKARFREKFHPGCHQPPVSGQD